MDFKFTDEQELLRKMIQKFAEKEIAPRYEEIEKEGYQQDLTDKMADVGIVGIAVPEAYGGAGYDFVTQTMVIAELAKVNPGVAFTLEAHWKAIDQLVVYGSEEIKARWLPRANRELFTFGQTEPASGSDASTQQTTAVQTPDGWLLNGNKAFLTNGVKAASMYLILAITSPEKDTEHSRTVFILDNQNPGFENGRVEDFVGMRGCPVGDIYLSDALVPDIDRLGPIDQGMEIGHNAHYTARFLMGALAAGIQDAALKASINYIQERELFGGKMSHLDGIKFRISDIAMGLHATKLIIYQAAWLRDQEVDHKMETTTAKLFGSDQALKAANHAMQIFGAYGYSKEYPVEHLWRDAKALQYAEGAYEKLQLDIANSVLFESREEFTL
ncbi:acyl-CoA dehydrogenase AcdA [Aerococcus viridans]|uniref:acyl-CoA dehydrogenase family protein n=1 Tax=Aerococcus TaxID=1375 RepID=UPI0028FDC1DC|nr:acyl-CoA dehydrogenase AcdA [Aerococcus viridans]